MTRRLPVDPHQPDPQVMSEAADLILQGKVIVLPTDTAYGLAGNPREDQVVERILKIKGRMEKPGMPLLAASLDQVTQIVEVSPIAEELAAKFWPGSLTLILPARQSFPSGILGPNQSLAVRIPDHPVPLAIIQQTAFPITGTSANRTSGPSPRTAEAANRQVGAGVDLILDAGPTQHQADSTILNCTVVPPRVIRYGAVSSQALRPWLKEV